MGLNYINKLTTLEVDYIQIYCSTYYDHVKLTICKAIYSFWYGKLKVPSPLTSLLIMLILDYKLMFAHTVLYKRK